MTLITFEEPVFALLLLILLPIIIALIYLAQKKKKKAAVRFSHLSLLKKATTKKFVIRKNIIQILSFLVLACMLIALADPHLPLEQEKEGVNVVLVLDVSGSMQANDYTPTRLEAAKSSAKVLLESLKPKDHAGVVIFESGATTSAYLSPFKDKVIDKLLAITPRQGRTAIGDGLSLGVDMATSIPNKKKVVILLSDGSNNAGVIGVNDAVEYARINDIQVHTVGVGSNEQVVLGHDFFGRPQYAEPVDEATLAAIARATGGKFYKSVDTETLEEVYRTIGDNIKREKEPTSIKNWFIGLGILLLLIELVVKYGPKRIISW